MRLGLSASGKAAFTRAVHQREAAQQGQVIQVLGAIGRYEKGRNWPVSRGHKRGGPHTLVGFTCWNCLKNHIQAAKEMDRYEWLPQFGPMSIGLAHGHSCWLIA